MENKSKAIAIVGSLKNFISKDETRPAMGGVYFSPDGHAVATNGHFLIKKKIDFAFSGFYKLGKGVSDEGDIYETLVSIDERFPAYENVMPTAPFNTFKLKISELMKYISDMEKDIERQCNIADLKGGLAGTKSTIKAIKRGSYAVTLSISPESKVTYDIKNLKIILNYFKKEKVEDVEVQFNPSSPESRVALFVSESITALIMPFHIGQRNNAFEDADFSIEYKNQYQLKR